MRSTTPNCQLAEAEVENERLKIKVQQAMAVKDDLASANEQLAGATVSMTEQRATTRP